MSNEWKNSTFWYTENFSDSVESETLTVEGIGIIKGAETPDYPLSSKITVGFLLLSFILLNV